MGWVSTSEDIEERRLEDEVRKGFDAIIKKVRRTQSIKDLQREQENLETLSRRLIQYLENKKSEALKAFHEATKIFNEPHVRIMDRLEKREKQLQGVREKLNTTELNLEKCRTKREELEAALKSARQENLKLEKTIEQLSTQAAWIEEKKTIKPLRRS